ncbi:hypothetical protein HDU67_002966, partial [Dinochytrium kinnereticum]
GLSTLAKDKQTFEKYYEELKGLHERRSTDQVISHAKSAKSPGNSGSTAEPKTESDSAKQKVRYKCQTHSTNDHAWKDDVCQKRLDKALKTHVKQVKKLLGKEGLTLKDL